MVTDPTSWTATAAQLFFPSQHHSFSQGKNTQLCWSQHKQACEEPQWYQSLQGIKKNSLHSEDKLIIGRRIFFFCETGTARLIFGQEHVSVPCKGLVDYNWRLPLFSWSRSQLEFSFVALPDMPNTFLLNLCSHFNIYSKPKPLYRLFFLSSASFLDSQSALFSWN